jgi:hypothetical protein
VETTRFEPAGFLNIDLDVKSRRSLTPLVTAWPLAYLPIKDEGREPRWIILNARGSAKTAEGTAKVLLRHIASLRGDALRCWKDAHGRVFDIGIRPGGPGRVFEDVRLTPETLKRIAAVGAQIQVTVYWAEPESKDYIPPKRKASKRR